MKVEKEVIDTAIRNLQAAAVELNAASDKLSAELAVLNTKLKCLAMGVACWVALSATEKCTIKVGYTRFSKGGWGLAISETKNEDKGKTDSVVVWPIADAPRRLRLDGVSKIPELLENLAVRARGMTSDVERRTEELKQLIEYMGDLTPLTPTPTPPVPSTPLTEIWWECALCNLKVKGGKPSTSCPVTICRGEYHEGE